MKSAVKQISVLLLSASAAGLCAQGTGTQVIQAPDVKTVPPAYYRSGGASEASRFDQEEHGADVKVQDADAMVRDATKAYQSGWYDKAIKQYREALEIFGRLSTRNPEVKKKADLCREAISRAYFHWAEQLYADACASAGAEKFDEAIRNCREAAALWPACRERMERAIKKFTDMKNSVAAQNDASEKNIDPGKTARLYRLDVLQKQGDAYYKDGQYDKARDKYEEILSQDPYNFQAIESIRKVNMKLYEIGVRRTNTTRREVAAEMEWKMISPGMARLLAAPEGKLASAAEPIVKTQKESPVAKKLKSIQLDSVLFDDVPLDSVFKSLMERSKELDPEKTGVNIILLDPSKSAAAAPADNAQAGGGENGGAAVAGGENAGAQKNAAAPAAGAMAPITMSTENVSLLEAIQYICKSSKLQYKIDDYALVIAPEGYSLANLERKIYIIEGTTFSRMKPDDIKKYFEAGGVKFPEGASAIYLPSSGRLIVNNTHDELEKVDERIRQMNTRQPQILIETKFVEVQLNDAEELGFHYSVSRLNSNVEQLDTSSMDGRLTKDGVTQKTINTYSASANALGYHNYVNTVPAGVPYAATNEYYTVAPIQDKSVQWGAGNQAGINRTLRDLPEMKNQVDGLFGYQHYNEHGYKIAATVTALDQADSQDILSCPRVTTVNGYSATIRMVTKKYFPESWEEPEISNDANNKLFIGSVPSFGDPKDLGITLGVTPRTTDMRTVVMSLNPSITTFSNWDDYSYKVNEENSAEPYTVIQKMPIFEVKSITTEVQCADGETIIIGGIVQDTVNAIDDQYPVLGTLPLVGRLFQSKGKRSAKKNLLVFLTCRLINPDGSPLRERYMRGLPPFRQ